MLEARKATIDVEVLNLTELSEPIRMIEWKTVYVDTNGGSRISFVGGAKFFLRGATL